MRLFRLLFLISPMLLGSHARAQQERRAVEFDGRVRVSGNAQFEFARPVGTYAYDGALLGPDEPRWAPPTLFCGPMSVETLVVGRNINAIGAGRAGDGQTPAWVVHNASQMQLTIHTGEGSVERAYRNGDWSGAYRLLLKDASKQNKSNLLVGQTGANGGSADQPGMVFSPTTAAGVHNGLVVVGCEVLELSGSSYVSTRVALAYTTIDRLSRPDPWIIAALGEPTNLADWSRSSLWALSCFPASPSELVAAWTDYRMTSKTGGVCYATRFVHSGGQWQAETIRVLRDDAPVVEEHFHCAGYIRHPDGRQSLVVSIGDSIDDNRLVARTLAGGGAWASADVIPGTGLDARSVVHACSEDWTPAATVWGGTGSDPGLRHNQVITMRAADPECSAIICGGDENDATVFRLEYDPDRALPTWTTLGMPTVTSCPGDGVIAFTLEGVPGGPYLSRIDAAARSGWEAEDRETRILFSPDGAHWGQCFVPMTKSNRSAVFVGGNAYLGSLPTEPVGFRRLAMPAWELVRPLAVSRSGENLLRNEVPLPVEQLDAGAAISALAGVADLPAGVPPPPCAPTNMFLVDNDAVNGRLGLWRPVSDSPDAPAPLESVLVRAWLYALAPEDADDPATMAQLTVGVEDVGGDRLRVVSERADFEAGQWCPLTFWAPATGFAPGETWMPGVALLNEPRRVMRVRNRFLIAWEGFYQDAPTVQGIGLPPGAAGAAEEAWVRNLSLSGEWTIFLAGMTPYDQWDNRTGGECSTNLFTSSVATPELFSLVDSGAGDELSVAADPAGQGIILSLWDGQSEAVASSAENVFWLRGSPTLCMLRCREGELTLDYSIGGAVPERLTLPGSLAPGSVRLGPDPMLWKSVEALPYALDDQELADAFGGLSLRCRADFNRDSLVNTQDVLAFLNAWVKGDGRADYDHDGLVNTMDVLAFLNSFTAGC
ncbi:MAG TPA: GC-type dockerin domain-anchored protein [Phycisphaerales bacterium]|nr:GC-type dockerin domain-anchored protein [Phycisphaerales bacterium]